MAATHALHALHITDMHLHADADAELYGVRTDRSFRAVMDRAQRADNPEPDIVLVTGDLVEDRSEQGYRRFRSIMQAFDVPVLCLPGNHDDPGLMSRVLNDGNVSFCASHGCDDWRFIMLDSHIPGDDGGELGAAELQRLDEELASAAEANILVAVHHHPLTMGSAWLDGYGLRDAEPFLSLLSRYRNVRAVLWGHVHQASDRHHDGLRMLSTPSTCAQFTPGTATCVMDIRPPGFRSLTLRGDGAIETAVT
ncbi:MAG: 3',5'-cyclic-AMP phosphodiesterase, partial [Gammaproteobacteria bacterium]|nr:3',5'-cyclic-AMP phosphodiesterase [Gammaproteobacteria bacterium]